MKNFYQLNIFIFITIFISSCSGNTIFTDYQELNYGIWAKDKVLSFDFEINDTLSTYELDLMLRNSNAFPRQNLWLYVEQEFNGGVKKDTVNIQLLDEQGKWIGHGIGDRYDNTFIWKQRVRFPARGKYTFRIMHLMRFDVLEGIERVGISVLKEKQ